MTGRQWITDALQDLNVYGESQQVTDADAQRCLRIGNQLIDSLALDRSWLYRVVRVEKALVASTASYTIGTGGSINTPRPDFAPQRAGVVIDTTATVPIERPLDVYDDDQWASIAMKTLTSSLPKGIYFDFHFASSLATIYPWPIPTGSNQLLRLYLPAQAVAQFADLDTEYTAPRGYDRALRWLLCAELAPAFERPLPPRLETLAADALERIRDVNQRPHLLRCDDLVMLARGPYTGRAIGNGSIYDI